MIACDGQPWVPVVNVATMNEEVSVTRQIAAPADRLWAMVADLPRMGEWSNENVGGKWLHGAAGPVVGAKFRGANRRGFHRWKTKVTILDADPRARLRFKVGFFGIPVSEWQYRFEPTDDGCRVTESWSDRRPGWFKPLAHLATGVGDRAEYTRQGIAETLDRLAAAAELT